MTSLRYVNYGTTIIVAPAAASWNGWMVPILLLWSLEAPIEVAV